MKDVYFSGRNNNNDDIDLTPEEKELIRQRRIQKMREQNNKNYDFIKKPADPKVDTADIPVIKNNYEFNDRDYDVFSQHYNSAKQKSAYQRSQKFEPEYDDSYYPQNDQYSHQKKNSVNLQNVNTKKKKNKGCGCLTAMFVSVFLIFVILITGTFGYVYSMMGKTEKIELQQQSSQNLKHNDDILNILLVGLDDDKGGSSRSDTMMLMSVDKINKAIKLTSFLRDMWVAIPGHDNARINAAFTYGGIDLTVKTIENNFNVDIDHTVIVDFDMFKNIIDALGGVEVEITQKESDFINRTTSVTVKPGINKLDGKGALVYARIRKLDSDFNRTQRQRKVITAIIKKAVNTNPFELISAVSKIMPSVKTDINALQLTGLALNALKYIKFDINQLQVPADNAYTSKRIKGQAVLVPDMDKNRDNIIKFIYG